MAYKSSAAVERDFFAAFFSALRVRGCKSIEWGGDADVRFLRAYRRLEEYASEHGASGDLTRVMGCVRPDPVTGASPAFSNALMESHGYVAVDGPWNRFALTVPTDFAQQVVSNAPEYLKPVLDEIAEAFVRRI
ncbi:hypothetical protein HY489_03825 [Candidatus Woesearchaeota archaeon]|nr:hypothetical protein [Candidatus Woesearchaeota archaeon]